MSPLLFRRSDGLKFFWNLDANVGLNSPNRTDDVQLVQFGYLLMSRAPATPAIERAAFAEIEVGAACTGKEDDPLVQAIRVHQQERGGTQDGHVSPIHTPSGIYVDAGGSHTFMLIAIINNIFDATKDDFPRIDAHPECPAAVKAAVLRASTL